jgi:hypothetical protein
MFVTVSVEGMTSGALGSVTEVEEKSTDSGGKGNWAVGRFQNQAEVLPAALFLFSNSFLFSFSIFI